MTASTYIDKARYTRHGHQVWYDRMYEISKQFQREPVMNTIQIFGIAMGILTLVVLFGGFGYLHYKIRNS